MRQRLNFLINSKRLPGLLMPLVFIFMSGMNKPPREEMKQSYLALGDSYTIGEQVEEKDNFPNQLTALLNKEGKTYGAPRIIAQTGWTTDELQAAINRQSLNSSFDLVTLLIGVNNQYRGRKVEEYKIEFETLLKQAIVFAGNNSQHVVVLSIPDWGVTPFAAGRDRQQISSEIDAYNNANKMIAAQYHVQYINVTESTREAASDNSLLAPDGLHPSAKEYGKWAKKLATCIHEKM